MLLDSREIKMQFSTQYFRERSRRVKREDTTFVPITIMILCLTLIERLHQNVKNFIQSQERFTRWVTKKNRIIIERLILNGIYCRGKRHKVR